ncbi:DNA-binding transcriptional ArsR family regulator [Pseudarthrobacter defluvii]|uniref:ArsR/SmtB family transcription factor n=1 Tax=Pseudarthrobacter defluvii TaxID=410837 RepID=UPI002785B030|nr:metalloregulator ArsR/SmtB family transcription factor [Pseudarthrobacter defluvii]MDQ0768212.1 DNA-binding transcriptional ArsR family regulator [Pseudarthrobacter defluvii]
MNYTERAGHLKGLGDETRLRIVELLAQHKELSVADITYELGLPQPTVSKHLKILRDFNVVEFRKDTVRRFYHLNRHSILELQRFAATLKL